MTAGAANAGMATSRPNRRDEQRDRILDASRSILEQEGAKALTIRRLAEAIDRTQPAIYSHFSNKEALLEELVVEGFGALCETLIAALRSKRRSSLFAISEAYIAFGTSRPHLYDAMFVGETTIAFAAGVQTPAAARATFDVLKKICRATEPKGAKGADETRTEVYWAALHGLVMLANNQRLRAGANFDSARVRALVALMERGVKVEGAT